MNFQEAIQSGFQNYANFSGRSSRSAYWYWVLFGWLVSIVTAVLDAMLGAQVLQLLTSLGLIIPGLAVGIRRLHDVDKSALNLLWIFLPLLGAIYLIYLSVQPSDDGPNSYGDAPMAPPA